MHPLRRALWWADERRTPQQYLELNMHNGRLLQLFIANLVLLYNKSPRVAASTAFDFHAAPRGASKFYVLAPVLLSPSGRRDGACQVAAKSVGQRSNRRILCPRRACQQAPRVPSTRPPPPPPPGHPQYCTAHSAHAGRDEMTDAAPHRNRWKEVRRGQSDSGVG